MKKNQFKKLSGFFSGFPGAQSGASQYRYKKKASHSKGNIKGEVNTNHFFHLIKNWSEIVGKNISKHTIPLKHVDETLVILSGHSAFSQQLSLMELQIKKKIFEELPIFKGTINKLRFMTNSSFFDEQKLALEEKLKVQEQEAESQSDERELHHWSPEYRKLSKEAEEYLNEFEDGEIKDSLKKLYIQSKHSKNK